MSVQLPSVSIAGFLYHIPRGMSQILEASIHRGPYLTVITYFIKALLILPALSSRAIFYFFIQKLS